MKLTKLFTVACLCLFLPLAPLAADFNAEITDSAWDGKKVPDGQQCDRFGGKAKSPKLDVSGIPKGANALVLQFDDRSHAPMNNGGHGQVTFAIKAGVEQVNVPSVPAHTFDLPAGFALLAAHKAPTWDTAGAYMPPCSGGRGNEYVMVVKAVQMDGGKVTKTLAEFDVKMGRY